MSLKLAEIRGEEALDVLADLIEPAVEIASDKAVAKAFQEGGSKAAAIKAVIKGHKPALIAMLAALEREDPAEYAQKINLFTLPAALLALLNDPDIVRLFTSQGQTGDATSSASVSENTEG